MAVAAEGEANEKGALVEEKENGAFVVADGAPNENNGLSLLFTENVKFVDEDVVDAPKAGREGTAGKEKPAGLLGCDCGDGTVFDGNVDDDDVDGCSLGFSAPNENVKAGFLISSVSFMILCSSSCCTMVGVGGGG